MNTSSILATLRSMVLAAVPVVVPAIAAGAITVFASGCAGDSYYCDNTSCYFCDGTSCRPATPPTPTMCQRDSQCTGGLVCTSQGCVAPNCRSDRDCGNGLACVMSNGMSYCAPPGSHPTPVVPTCSSSAQCMANEVCLNGGCVVTMTPACMNDSNCSNGRLCVSGRCIDRTSTCQFDNQCGAGRVCINSECRDGCGAGGACSATQECVTAGSVMYCRDRATPACMNNAGCAATEACLNGRCLPRCTPGAAAMCAAGTYCSDDGVCIVDTRPRPQCDAGHPCAAGSECVGGICRVQCAMAPECQRVAVTYRGCGPIPYIAGSRNYCLTDSETRPTCARQADCAAGQVCSDGSCR